VDVDALRVLTPGCAHRVHLTGRPNFTRLQKEGQNHPIEQVGEKLRGLMSRVGTKAT
jgi:hypothetical protein